MFARANWLVPFYPEREEPLGFYSTDARLTEADAVHAKLLQAIAGNSGMRLYTADVYETDCGSPVGYIDLAIATGMEKACGIFRQCCEFTDEDSTPPIWFSRQPTPDETLELFVEGLNLKAGYDGLNQGLVSKVNLNAVWQIQENEPGLDMCNLYNGTTNQEAIRSFISTPVT